MTHWLTQGHSEIDLRETMHRCGFRKPGLYRVTKEGAHVAVFHKVGLCWEWRGRVFRPDDLVLFLRAEYHSATDSHILLVFLDTAGVQCGCYADYAFSEERHLLIKGYFEPVTE